MEINIKHKTIICPICQRDDSVQKITAAVSSGTMTGSFSGPTSTFTSDGNSFKPGFGFTTVSGSARSDLAKLLSPPPKPKERRYNQGCGAATLWFVVLLGGFILIAVVLGEVLGEMGGIFVGALIICGIGIVYAVQERDYRKNELPELMRAYRKGMKRWERAYYCYRDDIVFDPNDGKTCSPDSLITDFYYSDMVR